MSEEVRLTTYAKQQLEQKLCQNLLNHHKGRKFYDVFQLGVLWYRYILEDLIDLGNNSPIKVLADKSIQEELWRTKSYVTYSYVEDDKGRAIKYILYFKFKSFKINTTILEQQIHYQMCPELKAFHSWMQRLDEVKGARPTYWCK